MRLEVRDSGPGVPPAELARLGERFYRLGRAEESGSGLGLSIVLRIADLHGAQVGFSSSPDKPGLRVSVTFPSKAYPGWRSSRGRERIG